MKPSQARALRNIGFVDYRDCQRQLLAASIDYSDVLFQSRGGTGKSSGLGFIISHFCKSPGISVIIAPRANLVSQLFDVLTRQLSHEFVNVQIVDGSNRAINWAESTHFVLIGVPAHVSVLSVAQSVAVTSMYFDEADELFGDSLFDYSKQCLCRFLNQSTRTVFLSATFPPYIVSRIEDNLPFRVPRHVQLCRSTSTLPSSNPILPHIRYHAYVVADQYLLGTISHILKSFVKQKCIIFGGSIRIAHSLSPLATVELVTANNQKISSSSQIIVDVHSYCSRGLNIPDLRVGIAVGFVDKETLIHQFGRIAREADSSGDFFVIVSNPAELNFLSFQLGIEFQLHYMHPFELTESAAERWRNMVNLASHLKDYDMFL